MALPGLRLFFGLNGLQHIAGLGDMGEIDLGRYTLRCAGGRTAGAGPGAPLKLRTHLLGLKVFQGTGVGLTAGQAELRQYVKNLLALDFHLACEIVDTNLTHPPLFKMCYPKPVSRS
jgi:hypothetical protein